MCEGSNTFVAFVHVNYFNYHTDVQGLLRQPKHRLTVDHYFTVETFSQQSSLGPPSEIVVTVLNGTNISEDKINPLTANGAFRRHN